MKIEKEELAQKLNKIKGAVPKKGNIPALHGILVMDGYLTASNTEMTVKAKIEGIEGEKFIIPENAFDLISNLPDGEVEISATAEDSIIIKVEKIRNKYQTLDPGQFPEIPGIEAESELEINADAFLESIKRVSSVIPALRDNAVISSLCLQAGDGYLNFVGLDGRVLAWDKIDYAGEFELLIPKNTVDNLRAIGFSGSVKIRHNKAEAAFITEEFEVYTRLVEGKYFRYKTMFNKLPMRTVISRSGWMDAMTRAKMCTKEKCPVRFELEGSSMNLSIKDQTTDYREIVELQKEMEEPLVIGFDTKIVLETLKSFDCKNIGVSFGGSKMPMLMEAEDSNFKAIVLPVVIK